MTIVDIEVSGFQGAMIGMRLPYNSKNDSMIEDGQYKLGKSDLELLCRLVKEGQPNRKVLRMIHVQLLVTAPRYWWIEADTYKVGTVTNSESTMHTLLKRGCFQLDDFEHDENNSLDDTIQKLNFLHGFYDESSPDEKKKWWREIIQLLPQSYLQTRVWDLNYETLINIYKYRKNHKLPEWRMFCSYIREVLPYMDDILGALE